MSWFTNVLKCVTKRLTLIKKSADNHWRTYKSNYCLTILTYFLHFYQLIFCCTTNKNNTLITSIAIQPFKWENRWCESWQFLRLRKTPEPSESHWIRELKNKHTHTPMHFNQSNILVFNWKKHKASALRGPFYLHTYSVCLQIFLFNLIKKGR